MKANIYSEKFIQYVKAVLIAILFVTEILVCAQTAISNVGGELIWKLLLVTTCCILLAVVEAVDGFAIKNFVARMVLFGLATALLLVICLVTGNSLLSTLYTIVLTQIYINIPKFSDKLIIFGISCALFTISFVVGWVFANPNATIVNSAVEILSGALLGLLVLAIDFIIVQFLLRFYSTNKELSTALKQADESRAQLERAYEKLSETAVFEERNRIAKDIHDNAGHAMTTVIMQTEAAKLLFDTDPAEAKNRIISANIQARNALEQMRESVHLLAGRQHVRPLSEELEEIIAQTIDGTALKVRFDLAEVDADVEKSRFLCNSLKECLTNGIRHGGATAFYIELKKGFGVITLYISDNGKGAEGQIEPAFGLKGIIEKANSLGGSCQITSEAGEGFEVTITLPDMGSSVQKPNPSAQNEVNND